MFICPNHLNKNTHCKFVLTDVFCPATHPYAYFEGGRYCCQTGYEDVAESGWKQGAKCDGGPISSSSLCCKDDAYIKCSGDLCKNFEGTNVAFDII